jgi:DNA-directed RNA polymerase subunit alpha
MGIMTEGARDLMTALAPPIGPGGRDLNELEPAHIEVEEETETYVRIVAEPLAAGFGTTLGNALRRVLLSSLPGAAVTSVRIEEVEHEFSTIPFMKEDTTEFLLNIKEIRLRSFADRPAKLYLEASGEGPVTAGSIQTTADYEIVNPELSLATLDAPEGRLTVELNVETGQGYAPAGHSDGLPIGVIPVDAIFSPVRRVNFHVAHTRVGQMTNYDRLTLEVWTDGTIAGIDAISKSADILQDEVRMFAQLGKPLPPTVERGLGIGTSLPPDKYNMAIEELNLSVRAYNCLKRSGLMTVGAVLEKSEDELLSLRNFGRKSYDELRDKLAEMGLLPPPEDRGEDYDGGIPIGRTPAPTGDGGDGAAEDLSPLGAALIEALREAGEDPSDLIRKRESE